MLRLGEGDISHLAHKVKLHGGEDASGRADAQGVAANLEHLLRLERPLGDQAQRFHDVEQRRRGNVANGGGPKVVEDVNGHKFVVPGDGVRRRLLGQVGASLNLKAARFKGCVARLDRLNVGQPVADANLELDALVFLIVRVKGVGEQPLVRAEGRTHAQHAVDLNKDVNATRRVAGSLNSVRAVKRLIVKVHVAKVALVQGNNVAEAGGLVERVATGDLVLVEGETVDSDGRPVRHVEEATDGPSGPANTAPNVEEAKGLVGAHGTFTNDGGGEEVLAA
mmetsp:Transcript_7281/g.23298  ORF Transcript_7281/g.23298 Transcript_7281/m.23298 type:complete len:280 (+) Transcript_7281:2146-2985(+)